MNNLRLQKLKQNNPDILNYSLRINESLSLCCYHHAKDGDCFASMANSPNNVYDFLNPNFKIRANAKIVYDHYNKYIYLVATKEIYENVEISTNYE